MYDQGNQGKYQQVGIKGLERFDITVRVILTIDLMGDMFTALRFSGINPESEAIYQEFINNFFKLFHISSTLLKDSKDILQLLAKIDEAFQGSLVLTSDTSSVFIDLFEDYLFALKDAGVYDPAVTRYYNDPARAWEGSI